MFNIISVLINMDNTIGKDFADGLARLQSDSVIRAGPRRENSDQKMHLQHRVPGP
jgi:hypothetical protein